MANIGEAVNQLRKLDPQLDLPDADRIVSMRNRLIHSYDNIDDSIVWGVILHHLPPLKKVAEQR